MGVRAKMSDMRRPDAEAPINPMVAVLRVADGATLEDAAPFAGVLTPPARVKRGREGENLFFLFSPTGKALPNLCGKLRDIVRETYWSGSGSVTAALRRSASVVNRYLFEHNLNADRSERCYGGLACAVLRDRDVFLLQAGPVWSCVLQEDRLRCFPRGEKLAHMGIGPLADARLHHVFADVGDTLLLAPYKLLRSAGQEGLRVDADVIKRVLSLGDVNDVAGGLEQVGSDDFAALVTRWEPVAERRAMQAEKLPQTRRPEEAPSPPGEAVSQRKARTQARREPRKTERRAPEEESGRERLPTQERRRRFREAWVELGRRLKGGLHQVGNALGYVWHGFAAVGAGLLALGNWLGGAIATTFRSMLPGSEGRAHRRTPHHPPPAENRTVTMAIAVAIPIVILAVVLIAYRQFAAESRLQGMIGRAKEQIALAQAAEDGSEVARAHWEQALEQAEAAATLQPDDPSIQTLRDQARESLDRFDDIERIGLTQLGGFGSSKLGRHLILHDRTLFVLDSEEDWVAQVGLDDVGQEGTEGEEEQNQPPVLMHTGQRIGGEDIGPLVDAAWVDGEGGRQSSALLVLAEGGQLISYDPAWRSESGAPQLSLLELDSPPPGRSVAVGSYQGRFYVLDTAAEGAGQIWRYKPQGNAYPSQPERYFTDSPPESLGQALDMAIDGHIYVLHPDGNVMKFLGGERQPFEIQGIPEGLGEIAGFAVDPEGDGTVYIADRGHNRIVVLGPDGRFQSQLRAEPPLTSLEALAVNQAEGQLYVLAAGQVYAAALP
jgi:hypothetical protein